MLTTLRRKPTAPEREPDAVDMLLECHDRIRRFTGMAEWLATAQATAAPASEVQETAAGVLRYFTEALPHHSADEDFSLAPRLLGGSLPDELRAAVTAMTAQHGGIEATLGALIPGWRAVAGDASVLPAHAAELGRSAAALRGLWDVHLALEESTIFPAVRARFSPGELAEVLVEMLARRG